MSLRDDVSVMPQQMHGNNAISLLNGEPHIIFTQGNGGANGMVHEPNGFQPQYMMGEAPLGSQALWERLLASEARISPMRSSASWLPEEPPEPDAPAPAAQSRGNYYAMLSQDFEALTLKRRSEASGLFGVGLQVSDDPPHLVQRVSRLLDRDRRNISDMVAIGDTLYSVNDFQVEMSSIDTVEQLIFGDLGTFVRLTFCNRNRQKYEVVVSRHVPISVWEQERVWYEIKPEFQGRELRCDPSIVHILETIRAAMSKGGEVPVDLLKDFHCAQTTLGFRIGVKSIDGRLMSCVVQQVIPGSAADQGSGLQPGDLIIAVNGVHISDWDENKLLEAFRGDDIIGSKCRLTIERPEAKHLGPVDVEVLRTNASFAKEVELLFLLGQEHAALLQSQASHDALNASLQAMMHQAVALERHRILNEQVLAARLRSLQGRVLESITDAERRITVSANDVDNQRLKDLEGTHEHMSELLMLLRGPPTVPPAKLASAVRGANMGAHDLLLILEAIAQERLSTNEAVGRIHASPQDDDLLAKLKASEARCAAQDREITNLKDKIEAGCQACKEKDEDIAKLTRNPAQAQRASPKITRAAVPPPAAPQPPPLIVPPGGKFDKIVSAVIKSDIPGAIVYCTTDGSAPTQSNCAQSGPSPLLMQVEKSSRIRAVCSANGRTTLEAEAEFVLEAPAALAGAGLLLEEKSKNSGVVFVKTIIPGGAAQEDGRIKLQDQVTHVDSTAVKGLSLEQILELIKGTEGTKVKLDVIRPSDGQVLSIELSRKKQAKEEKKASRKSTAGGTNRKMSTSN